MTKARNGNPAMIEKPSEPGASALLHDGSASDTSPPIPTPAGAVPSANGADGADLTPDFMGTLRRPMTIRLTPMTIVLAFVAAILLVFLVNALGQLLDLMLLFFLGVT